MLRGVNVPLTDDFEVAAGATGYVNFGPLPPRTLLKSMWFCLRSALGTGIVNLGVGLANHPVDTDAEWNAIAHLLPLRLTSWDAEMLLATSGRMLFYNLYAIVDDPTPFVVIRGNVETSDTVGWITLEVELDPEAWR